jgi:hypothetical protein
LPSPISLRLYTRPTHPRPMATCLPTHHLYSCC